MSTEIVPQVGGQIEDDIFAIPWGHHKLIMDNYLIGEYRAQESA